MATPALACRITPRHVTAENAAPQFAFTATVAKSEHERNSAGVETVTLSLDIQRLLIGPVPYTTTVAGELDEFFITGCGPIRPDPWALAQITPGTEVVVSGIDSPQQVFIVRMVEPGDSDRGRALLNALEAQASRP